MPPSKGRFATIPDDEMVFGAFRLDPKSRQFFHDATAVRLRPKTWDLLCLLVANPGQLLTKDDIIEAIWAGMAVGDALPGVSIAEIRRVLGDDPRRPTFIETVHGRGFRFVGELRHALSEAPLTQRAAGAPTVRMAPFVGRDRELAALDGFLSGNDGKVRVALIAGDAGIGKTTLVERLVEGLGETTAQRRRPFRVGRGHCVAHYGDGHPYLPVLGALRGMAREHEDVVPLLRSVAPSWLAHLPDLTMGDEVAGLRQSLDLVTHSRVVEEMFALLRALGPLLWVLEDLHWADSATLELVALVAENVALDDLRLIGTARLAESIAHGHGVARLRRELRRRDRCLDVLLEGLTEADVEGVLAQRFPQIVCPSWLAERLLQRTQGNPFFLVQTIDHLASTGALPSAADAGTVDDARLERALDAVPETLRESLREEIAALLEADRSLLGAASVGGLEVDAAMLAIALEGQVELIDAACANLARHGRILVSLGETTWPNGDVVGRYAFRHALYQAVLYEDQAPTTRRHAHGRIGRGLVAAFGERVGEVAAIVANHFERAGDFDQAVIHHQLAARVASHCNASREAARHLRRALDLLPLARGGDAREAEILRELGKVMPALAEGFGNPELLEFLRRAQSLHAAGADASADVHAMAGMVVANLVQRQGEAAEALANELLASTRNAAGPSTRAAGELLMGTVHYHRGELARAIAHTQKSIAIAPSGLTLGPIDFRCGALAMMGPALWQFGRPDEGLAQTVHACDIAGGEVNPFNRVIALQSLVALHHWRGDAPGALGAARELAVCIEEQGLRQAEACAVLVEAWALAAIGDPVLAAAMVERGIGVLRRNGTTMQSVYLLAVAVEVLVHLERGAEAGDLLDEASALVEAGDARWWEPELYRWRAVLLGPGARGAAARKAEGYLHRALDLAAQQGSRALRLRAALGLAHLRPGESSRRLVATTLKAIVGGTDTRDVREASALLVSSG